MVQVAARGLLARVALCPRAPPHLSLQPQPFCLGMQGEHSEEDLGCRLTHTTCHSSPQKFGPFSQKFGLFQRNYMLHKTVSENLNRSRNSRLWANGIFMIQHCCSKTACVNPTRIAGF